MQQPGRTRVVLTLGDVAGIGPEIILRAWPELVRLCVPTVVGDCATLEAQLRHFGLCRQVVAVPHADLHEVSDNVVPCIQATEVNLRGVKFGQVDAAAGRAAYDFLCRAVAEIRSGRAEALVTAPINKEALSAAGLPYPGHTEILAELYGVRKYAMMLFACKHDDGLSQGSGTGTRPGVIAGLAGWGVVHVTLHERLRDIFDRITVPAVLEKIELLGSILWQLLNHEPRIAVCGINPHASDGGRFGDEELRIIGPAVLQAQKRGWRVSGPWPADAVFFRAARGEFDGVVAMYHDQGHIPFKLLAGLRAVNITLGLPAVRTSVAHGTAYDIAGRGVADTTSLLEATHVAVRLAQLLKSMLVTTCPESVGLEPDGRVGPAGRK